MSATCACLAPIWGMRWPRRACMSRPSECWLGTAAWSGMGGLMARRNVSHSMDWHRGERLACHDHHKHIALHTTMRAHGVPKA